MPQIEYDRVTEEFLNRYRDKDGKLEIPQVDNSAGQLEAYRFLEDLRGRESLQLAKIANVRFVG